MSISGFRGFFDLGILGFLVQGLVASGLKGCGEMPASSKPRVPVWSSKMSKAHRTTKESAKRLEFSGMAA